MIQLILTALLAMAEPAAVEAASTPAPAHTTEALAALPASDLDIQQALWAAYRANPEKLVCVSRVLTGSRQPRQICGTLERWFSARLPSEVSDREPPYQLVEGVKEARRKAVIRDQAAKKRSMGG